MHQSDLYLPVPPITASRHATPARLPATAAGPTPTWPQTLSNPPAAKKRNVERACDDCRRRKTRCDGSKMPDNVCTNCVQNRKICTYIEGSKPRGPPKAYVTSLEDRMEKMEALLKRLRPETDFTGELGPPIARGSWRNDPDLPTSTSAGRKKPTRPLHQFHSLSTLAPLALSHKASSASLSGNVDHESDAESDAEDPKELLIQSMKRLTLLDKGPSDKANRIHDAAFRFHGKSTTYTLVNDTREMKTRYFLESMGVDVDTMTHELDRVRSNPNVNAQAMEGGLRRAEYWRSPNWELVYEGEATSETFSGLLQYWPQSDLATALIDLYFLHCNSMFPLLHRPTFSRHFTDRLYDSDIWFACTCMSVFALASRYTNDVRVLLDEPVDTPLDEHTEHSQWQTAGFKYYFPILEVEKENRAIIHPPSLFEVQTLCLMAQFQSETRWHRSSWYTIGVGIRKMQDIGAHSKQSYAKAGPTVENEHWKRVWWYLNGLDRMQAAILGRSCAAKDEDFNVEYPLEVDDEFWETDDPRLAFRQPSDKPSTVAAFNLWLRLTDFTASALHRFDIIEHDGPSSGLRVEDVLNQLNENLTEWAEKVPQHLKWSPDIKDVILANQSATLYATYNLVTILMQRAFLPSSIQLLSSPRDTRPAPPALAHAMTARAITINAAKAIARILAVVHRRGLSNVPLLLVGAEVTVAVLCIDQWIIKARDGDRTTRDGKLTPSAAQTIESHMQDVKWLLTALRWAAPRWETAQERLAYLERMVPDLEKESPNPGHSSNLNIVQEHQHGHLGFSGLPHLPTATSSRVGSHMLADIGIASMGMSTRHAQRIEDGPWLADLSRQYTPPHQTSAQLTPRISSHSFLPRIRVGDPVERPQRPPDAWTFSQRSYATPASLLPIPSGHPHVTSDVHDPPDFARVKHDPDGDPSMPPRRAGGTYVTHHPPSANTWEASLVRGNRYNAGVARDSSSSTSLLSHLHRPARDYTTSSFHGIGGVEDRDSGV